MDCYSPCTQTLGRKRVVIFNNVEAPSPVALLKRMCSDRITLNYERSPLEALPPDILVNFEVSSLLFKIFFLG